MTWNHRVVRKTYPNGAVAYGIHEVYYNESGVPDMCTQEPVGVCAEEYDRVEEGDALADLRETLERMLRCLDDPALDYEDFGREGKS